MKFLLGQLPYLSIYLSICRSKKPGEARPFFPFGSPPLAQPPRALLSMTSVNGAATQAQVRIHLPQRIYAAHNTMRSSRSLLGL